jgi:hypothetical protein
MLFQEVRRTDFLRFFFLHALIRTFNCRQPELRRFLVTALALGSLEHVLPRPASHLLPLPLASLKHRNGVLRIRLPGLLLGVALRQLLGHNASVAVDSAVSLQHFEFLQNSAARSRFFLLRKLLRMVFLSVVKLGRVACVGILMHVDAVHVLDPARLVDGRLEFPLALALPPEVIVVLVGLIGLLGALVFLETDAMRERVGVAGVCLF